MNVKEKIGQRIVTARKRTGLTVKALAGQTTHLKPARISNWEQGLRTPGPEEIMQISKALNVSAAYLMCLSEQEFDEDNHPSLSSVPCLRETELINLTEQSVKFDLNSVELPQNKKVPLNKTSPYIPGANSFAMQITDESMLPEFNTGDLLIIEPSASPYPGAYVLARVNNEIIFRKYRERQRDSNGVAVFELKSLNEDWPDVQISQSPDEIIIGLLREHRRFFQ